MNTALVDSIVKAVLYEGYMLYPYRPSAVKNQQRFNFGVVYPQIYSDAQRGADACTMRTECLLEGSSEARCAVRVRFLHMVNRTIVKRAGRGFEQTDYMSVDGRTFRSWQEALEEQIEIPEFALSALISGRIQWPFRISEQQEREEILDERLGVAGAIVRRKESIAGVVELNAEQLRPGLYKLSVQILNLTRLETGSDRASALTRSLVSAHTILQVRDGDFVSLVDPPEACRDFAQGCRNIGTWPVLVGDFGQRDTVLSSPIILYDYPQIAPESPGDLFDGAEIDEILSLRVMTMTDDEKREIREETDDRTRHILERTETLPAEHFAKLHGALRGLRAVKGETP